MYFAFTEEQEKLRREIREFCREVMTPELEALTEIHGGMSTVYSADVYKSLAARGWLGMQWPKEHGGGGAVAVRVTPEVGV